MTSSNLDEQDALSLVRGLDPSDDGQLEQWTAALLRRAQVRIRADHERLKGLGVVDDEGNVLASHLHLPPDMQPDSKTGV